MDQDRVNGGAVWLAPMVSAASVAAVVIVGVGLSRLDLDVHGSRGRELPGSEEAIHQVTRATNGSVADVFTCPRVIPYDFGGGGSALENVALGGPRPYADAMGAARFELVGAPEATVLRLGNADGSLASLNTMHRTKGGWVLDDMTACDGEGSMLVPAPNPAELGVHGSEPWSAEQVLGGETEAVLVDDREYYNAAGVIHHRSLYGFGCGRQVCLAGYEGSDVTAESVAGDGVPKDLTALFLPEEPLQDRSPPYAFLAVYDPDGRVVRVAWKPSHGARRWVKPTEGGPWTGQLYLVLAPYDPQASVLVQARNGRVRTYDATPYALP